MAASGSAMPTPRPTCCELVRLLPAAVAEAIVGVAGTVGVTETVGAGEIMVMQAEPLAHSDATLVTKNEMALGRTPLPRALATACTVAEKLAEVSALMLL